MFLFGCSSISNTKTEILNGFNLFLEETKEKAEKVGLEKGLEKGQAKAVIPAMLTKRFSDTEIADMLNMQRSFVKNIRQIIDLSTSEIALTNEQIGEKLAVSVDFVQFVRSESAASNTLT